jgi:DedD protein
MNWAFWRAKDAAAAPKADAGEAQDPGAELHARTRRRLIGAAALLLAAVIVLPMMLDSTPRPVPDSVAIDIPSDKTPFAPRLSTPAPAAPAPAPTPAVAPVPVPPAEAPLRKAESTPKPRPEQEPAKEAKAAPAAKDVAPAPHAVAGGTSFALQAAALGSEAAARDLMAKLKQAGFAPYTERVSTAKGDRIRVRVGPYATREDAEQARAKLKSLGISADVVHG